MTKGTILKRKRNSGFRSRMKTPNGKNILKAKRRKKRKQISL